jgi:DNA-binding SARP family transcriptional activator
LRQALYVLRRALGEGVIRSRGDEEVGVEPAIVWCDVDAFERAIAEGDDRGAAALYRGDLLHGFFVAGAPQYERWLQQERTRLRELAAEVEWRLSSAEEEKGDVSGSIRHARRAARLSPCDERALRRLVSLLVRAGDRVGAVHTYREFVREMWREYEVDPSPETETLIQSLGLGRPGR